MTDSDTRYWYASMTDKHLPIKDVHVDAFWVKTGLQCGCIEFVAIWVPNVAEAVLVQRRTQSSRYWRRITSSCHWVVKRLLLRFRVSTYSRRYWEECEFSCKLSQQKSNLEHWSLRIDILLEWDNKMWHSPNLRNFRHDLHIVVLEHWKSTRTLLCQRPVYSIQPANYLNARLMFCIIKATTLHKHYTYV